MMNQQASQPSFVHPRVTILPKTPYQSIGLPSPPQTPQYLPRRGNEQDIPTNAAAVDSPMIGAGEDEDPMDNPGHRADWADDDSLSGLTPTKEPEGAQKTADYMEMCDDGDPSKHQLFPGIPLGDWGEVESMDIETPPLSAQDTAGPGTDPMSRLQSSVQGMNGRMGFRKGIDRQRRGLSSKVKDTQADGQPTNRASTRHTKLLGTWHSYTGRACLEDCMCGTEHDWRTLAGIETAALHVLRSGIACTARGMCRSGWDPSDLETMLSQGGQHRHTPVDDTEASKGVTAVRARALEVMEPIFDALYNFSYRIGEQASNQTYPAEPDRHTKRYLGDVEDSIRKAMPTITEALEIIQGNDEDPVAWMRAVLAARAQVTWNASAASKGKANSGSEEAAVSEERGSEMDGESAAVSQTSG